MKKERIGPVGLMIAGWFALGAAQSIGHTDWGNILTIVGAILLVVGGIRFFRKPQKQAPSNTPI
jgi:hypothetical protein